MSVPAGACHSITAEFVGCESAAARLFRASARRFVVVAEGSQSGMNMRFEIQAV